MSNHHIAPGVEGRPPTARFPRLQFSSATFSGLGGASSGRYKLQLRTVLPFDGDGGHRAEALPARVTEAVPKFVHDR